MNHYSYRFTTAKSPKDVFDLLLDVEKWWSGIYEETIRGKSREPNDEFSFSAGGGMHFSKQQLVELIPDKKIVWLVTESRLSFLNNPKEWENTKLIFDISVVNDRTLVRFIHEGLEPQIECYNQCSAGWAQYLQKLENNLN
jgi:hypothetical protein